MRSATRFFPIVMLALGFFAGCWFGKSPEPAVQAQGAAAKWEHKFFLVQSLAGDANSAKLMTEEIAAVDGNNWEYAGVDLSSRGSDWHHLLFRRPKR